MTLQEITMPVDVVWARKHALVFASDMAQRLVQVQNEIGDQRYRLEPQLLADGRYACNADLLTECVPGGFLHTAFSRLDAGRFGEIEVVPMADVLHLMPQPDLLPPPLQTAPASSLPTGSMTINGGLGKLELGG